MSPLKIYRPIILALSWPAICYLVILSMVACGSSSSIGQSKERYTTLRLSSSEHTALRDYLLRHQPIKPTDTLVIKFDFNRESCWDGLDMQPDTYIQSALTAYQNKIALAAAQKPNFKILQYRQSGSAISKYKKWNKDIIIDDGTLRKLLFAEKTTCGSSAIILPNGECLLIKKDSHFDAIRLALSLANGRDF
jgi:hypothetical protein